MYDLATKVAGKCGPKKEIQEALKALKCQDVSMNGIATLNGELVEHVFSCDDESCRKIKVKWEKKTHIVELVEKVKKAGPNYWHTRNPTREARYYCCECDESRAAKHVKSINCFILRCQECSSKLGYRFMEGYKI